MNNIKYLSWKENIVFCKLINKMKIILVNKDNNILIYNIKQNNKEIWKLKLDGLIFNIKILSENKILIQTNNLKCYIYLLKSKKIINFDLKFNIFEKFKAVSYYMHNEKIIFNNTNKIYIFSENLIIYDLEQDKKNIIDLNFNYSLVIYSKAYQIENNLFFITFDEGNKLKFLLYDNKLSELKTIDKIDLVRKVVFWNNLVYITHEKYIEIYNTSDIFKINLVEKIDLEASYYKNIKNKLVYSQNSLLFIFDIQTKIKENFKLTKEKIIKIIEYSDDLHYLITEKEIIIIKNIFNN